MTIDGDLEYTNGDWLIENDASMKIQDGVSGNDIIRVGTHSGRKGMFLYDGNGMANSNIVTEMSLNTLEVAGGVLSATSSTVTISGPNATIDVEDFDLSSTNISMSDASGISLNGGTIDFNLDGSGSVSNNAIE